MENSQLLGSRLSTQAQVLDGAPAARWKLAKGISMIFSPPLLGIASLALLGYELNSAQNWMWIAFYTGLNVIAPLVYLIALMRAGEVSDFHMRDRLERVKPMRAILLFFFLSWLIFLASGAPLLFQVLALVGTLQSAVMYLITLRWKISGHGAGAAGFSVFLWGLYGTAAAPALLLIPIVIWARLSLERHDLPQSLAGAALGAGTMLVAFVLIGANCLGAGYLLCA